MPARTHTMSAHTMLALHPWIGAVVRIGTDADKDDITWDPGMLAVVLSVAQEDDDLFHVGLDFRPFMDHNTPLMSSGFYDKNKVPCCTAQEAGYWRDIATWYVDHPKAWGNRLTILGTALSSPPCAWIDGVGNAILSLFDGPTSAHLWACAPFPGDLAQHARAVAMVDSASVLCS